MSLALRAPGHLQCKNTTNRAICALNPCLRVPAPGVGAALSPYLQSASHSRSAAVVVYARKEDKDGKHEHDNGWAVERAGYIERERMLLEELAATRALVGRMLDQQQMLVQTITQFSIGGAVATAAAAAAPPPAVAAAAAAPATPAARSPAAPAAAATAAPWTPSTLPAGGPKAAAGSSSSSSSGDVPAPNSLADLFRNAATAASNNPAGAAAAAAIAAAVAAVDSHDILTAPADTLLPLAPFAAPAAVAPAASGTAGGVAPLPQPPIVFGTSGAVEEQEQAGAAAAGAGGDTSLDPIERPKASPTDPPPDLVIGDDDIFWMSKLHAGLEEKGFHPGDFDMENWVYGETTLNAVLTFQASERLPETGVVDRPTWTALLGAEAADELYARAAAAAAPAATSATTSSSGSSGSGSSSSSSSGGSSGSGGGRVSAKPAGAPLTRWPVLMEGDGGREVHALQVALTNCGFYTGEDDMRWWQFGDTTLTALKFYQSCNGLPESGVCDERSWRSLLAQCAPEAEDPQPNDIYGLRLARGPGGSDDEDNFEEDMEGVSNGRVWLLGEQRWEKRS